ncbi:MAG: LamG-like jellyroll fold domain-containing protein [Planctomycetota bacterium]|jgi:hypothetical protein
MKNYTVVAAVVLGVVAGQAVRTEALEYVPGSVVVHDSSGNGNGKLDPGESVSLSLSLVNRWADATNVQATLSCDDSFVSIAKGAASFGDVLYGGVTDNCADAFVVSLDGNCPGTYTLEFALEVTAEGPDSYSATSYFNYAVMVDQQGYDDGEADGYVRAWSWQLEDEGWAVRITPESYPCLLTHVRLYPRVGSECSMLITVWDDDGPAGLPGTLLGRLKTHVTAGAGDDWLDVDISSAWVRIYEGSFYVRFCVSGIGEYYNGIDMDPPYYGRSWHYYRYEDDVDDWYPFEDVGLSANLMVRVRYASSTEDGPVQNLTSGKRYDYIQQAIFESEHGDEIVAAEGAYNESIDLAGKNVTLRSTDPHDWSVVKGTVIRGDGEKAVVTFSSREDASCVLTGFTITDGNEGIYCNGGCPTVKYCNIVGNGSAGIEWETSLTCRWPTIANCSIVANDGNGIELIGRGNPSIVNCIIAENLGYGIKGRVPKLINCTLAGNALSGASCLAGTVSNCIIWDNGEPQIEGSPIVSYSDIEGGWEGVGNIDSDPRFVEPGPWLAFEASAADPAHGRINIDLNLILSWSAGRAAASHRLYFGTDLDAVSNATTGSNQFMGNQDSNSWDTVNYGPCGLAPGTTYYWRVDEVNESHVDSPWKGHVWSFTTFEPNLVGWWEFNEGAGGIAVDSSGYGNDGTIIASVLWSRGYGDGYSLEFNGGLVSVPDASELRPRHQVTASAWINYYEPYSMHGHVVCKGANDYETFSLERGHGYDQMNFMIRDNENYSQRRVWGFGLARDEWAHIAGVYDGAYMSCYINGEVQDSYYVGPMNLSQNTAGLGIGNREDDFDRPTMGMIDDVRVYDRGFSADEIRQAYQQGLVREQMVYYGGDYHLRPTSPCIDAGDNLCIPPDAADLDGDGNSAEALPCDMDGESRCVDYCLVADTGSGSPPIVDMGAYEAFVPPLKVSLAFTPQSLNPSSKGNWVKVHLALPEGVGMADVNAAGVRIIEPFEIEPAYVNIFGNKDSSVKIEAGFDRADFCGRGPVEGTIAVEGLLADGRRFRGEDTIKVSSNVFRALAGLASHWLAGDCGPPDWCGGLDVNRNSAVSFVDLVLLDGCCVELGAN